MTTTFEPPDYEAIRKALGYEITWLSVIKRVCDNIEIVTRDNVAETDYVAQTLDILDAIAKIDKQIFEAQQDPTYATTRIDIAGEISISRAISAKGGTAADGFYVVRNSLIRSLEEHLKPFGLHSQGTRIVRTY